MSANQTRLGRSAIKFWASRFGATGRESLLSVVHISRRRQLPERCRGRSGARQQVVAVAIEHAKADGTDAKWTGNVPNEPGKWTGTNPILRMAGTWLRRTGMADGGSPDDRTPPSSNGHKDRYVMLSERPIELLRAPSFRARSQIWPDLAHFSSSGAGSCSIVCRYSASLCRARAEYAAAAGAA